MMCSKGGYSGTCTNLLSKLRKYASENDIKSAGWPRSARALSQRLNGYKPLLRKLRIEINVGRTPQNRWIEIRYFQPEEKTKAEEKTEFDIQKHLAQNRKSWKKMWEEIQAGRDPFKKEVTR